MVCMYAKKQIDENTTVEIYLSIYISRNNFYKRVGYYVNDRKTTRRNKIIKSVIEGAPHILTANTFFWSGCACRGDYRTQKEFDYVYDVAEFFAKQGFDVELGCENCKDTVKFHADLTLDELDC